MLRNITMSVYNGMWSELNVTPKPGLVDRKDSGAHSDMNYSTFTSSINAVLPHFARIAEISYGRDANAELLAELRPIGIIAENDMFLATKGINTHKGQIFLLGLLSSASSVCGEKISPEDIQNSIRMMCKNIVEAELYVLRDKRINLTNGEKLYLQNGTTGIRGEAKKGFPSIFQIGLPVLMDMLNEGFSINDASIQVLLNLMIETEDTTVLNRTGIDGLESMYKESADALSFGGVRTEKGWVKINQMNHLFIKKRISPGGCADLLAGTLFLYYLMENSGDY